MLFDKIEVKIKRYRDKLTSKRVIPLKEEIFQESVVPSEEEIEETA
jgi:hypothetical protein